MMNHSEGHWKNFKDVLPNPRGKTTVVCINPLDHIILDELHLMLCITDVLIGSLVEDVMQWDDKESFLTGKKSPP